MKKRVLQFPATGDICTLIASGPDYVIEETGPDGGRNFNNLESPQAATAALQQEFARRSLQGWIEPQRSLSRRALHLLDKDGFPEKFWAIELEDLQLHMHYGRISDYSFTVWDSLGTRRTKDFPTAEAARYDYVQQILKKLKEGFVDADPRENEFQQLIDNPPPRPKKAPAKRAAAKKTTTEKQQAAETATEQPATAAGKQRFEFDDGKSKKFWTIELDGTSHTVQFGRIGTSGQTKTKEFPTEEKAQQSCDKLIAEKTGKGYQLVSVEPSPASDGVQTPSPETATAKGSARKSAKKKTAAESATPAATSAGDAATAPSADVVTEITSEIDLEPGDRARVTFRKRTPLARPEPAAFDLERCLKQLGSLRTDQYGWEFRWNDLDLPVSLSREEAHFWLEAMSFNREHREDPQFVSGKLSRRTFDGNLTVEQVIKLISQNRRGIPPRLMVPLFNLFSLDESISLLHADFQPQASPVYPHGTDLSAAYRSELASGLTTFILPYLSDAEVDQLQALLSQGFDADKSPDDFYSALPTEYYLAATVGMHDQVFAVTSRWADNRFSAGDDWTDHYQRPQDLVLGLGSAEAVAAEWRRLNLRMRTPQHVRGFLACTGLDALDCVAASVLAESNRDECRKQLSEFARVRAPQAARWMLQCKLSSKAPQVARQWLDRYVGNAVAGLIETAAGRGALADAAIQYLRDVKRRGHGELIAACLKDHSGETAAKVRREVVDFEEKIYEPFDEDSTLPWLREGLEQAGELKPQKLPGWADPATLPPLVIGEHRLNDRQTLTVLSVLKATATAEGHPLLAALREHGDRAALDQFAWRLFEFWMEDGAPAKEKWAMLAIAFFGNDQSALKLTPLVRAWPGESQHQRAVLGLECLRGIGSETALMQLNGIAQKVKFQGIKKKAREFMESIAEEKGMTREELEDRVVPDLDLNEQGTRQFDFGPRSFQFVLSPDMKPAVRDEAGKVRKDLPKPGVNDDSSRADTAIAEWKLLKKQLRDVIKIQVPRLEQSMVTGRRWSRDDFEMLLVRHPLMFNLVRTVLWGAYDDSGRLVDTFRVTDEQDYATADDETFSLEGVHQVGIVHPLHLADKDAARWGEVFSDYEIVTPFPQIGRTTYALEADEARSKSIDRFGHVKIPAVSLVGTLDRLGWSRGTPLDAGVFHEHDKPFYGADVTAVVSYEDGVPIGYMEGWDDQRVTGCYFLPGLAGSGWDYPDPRKGLPLGKVDPVVISEVLSDLYLLASKGS